MLIRKYSESDKVALVDLWEAVFPDDPPHNHPETVIDSKLAVDDLIFVAEHEGVLHGACMAGYDGHRGWLYSVAVASDQRRCGVGTELVKHTMSHLKEMGCVKVNLQIRSGNSAVASFYQSFGFETEDRVSMGCFLG